jgi:hypothetical protein
MTPMTPTAPPLVSAATVRAIIIVLIAVVFLLVIFSLYPGLAAKAVQNAQPTATPSGTGLLAPLLAHA